MLSADKLQLLGIAKLTLDTKVQSSQTKAAIKDQIQLKEHWFVNTVKG